MISLYNIHDTKTNSLIYNMNNLASSTFSSTFTWIGWSSRQSISIWIKTISAFYCRTTLTRQWLGLQGNMRARVCEGNIGALIRKCNITKTRECRQTVRNASRYRAAGCSNFPCHVYATTMRTQIAGSRDDTTHHVRTERRMQLWICRAALVV